MLMMICVHERLIVTSSVNVIDQSNVVVVTKMKSYHAHENVHCFAHTPIVGQEIVLVTA